MNITYTWRNADKTDAIEELATKKLEKISRHFDKINQIHIIFDSVKKQTHIAKGTLHVPGHEINAHAEHADLYVALDDLIQKLMKQVDNHKRQSTNHHN
jgi:putative sigma-54 modulation protein